MNSFIRSYTAHSSEPTKSLILYILRPCQALESSAGAPVSVLALRFAGSASLRLLSVSLLQHQPKHSILWA